MKWYCNAMPYKDPEKQKAYQREHYKKRKQEGSIKRSVVHSQSNKAWRDKRKHFNRNVVKLIKRNKPCMDCGINYPSYVMEFDHVRGVKRTSICRLKNTPARISVLLEEIRKCELVCANCHRVRTHKRGYANTRQAMWKRSKGSH